MATLATALRLFRPLADQGLAKAQLFLGVMYANGQGVPQNQVEAMNGIGSLQIKAKRPHRPLSGSYTPMVWACQRTPLKDGMVS